MLSPEWVSAIEAGVGVLIAGIALCLDIRRRSHVEKARAKRALSVDLPSDLTRGIRVEDASVGEVGSETAK